MTPPGARGQVSDASQKQLPRSAVLRGELMPGLFLDRSNRRGQVEPGRKTALTLPKRQTQQQRHQHAFLVAVGGTASDSRVVH